MVLSALQKAVVFSGIRFPPLRAFYALFYGLALRLLAGSGDRVKSVYLRQGLLDPGWVPGSSDIDTLWVLPDEDTENAARAVSRRLARMRTFFPFLGEAQLTEEKHLALYRAAGDAKRVTVSRWRPLKGAAPAAAPAAAPDWRRRWDAWSQALEAYDALLKRYFSTDADTLLGRVELRKQLLNLHRWLDWAAEGGAAPKTREETAARLQGAPHPEERLWAGPLGAVSAAPAAGLPALIARAHARLVRDAGPCFAAVPAAPARATPLEPRREDDPWETQAWDLRFRRLKEACPPGPRRLLWRTVTRATVVFDDNLDEAALAGLVEKMRDFKRGDAGLRAPASLLSETLFRLRLCTIQEGTPFAWWSLRPGVRGTAAWRLSKKPLFAADFSGQSGDFSFAAPPPDALLRALAREAAAGWLLNWRALGDARRLKPALYWFSLLLGPALGLRLYLDAGLAGDPADLDGLLRAYAARYPEDRAWCAALEGLCEMTEEELTPRRMEDLLAVHWDGFRRAAEALSGLLS